MIVFKMIQTYAENFIIYLMYIYTRKKMCILFSKRKYDEAFKIADIMFDFIRRIG